ncbi:MAG TPA: PD-(D/E)XK nuclease family protein, partial [Methanocorpusculum sp.]|nr:PD-(D/E)XK nuclease family protein [Methanocorpusculum sp.]
TDSGVKRIDRLVEYSDGSYAIIDYKSESADTAVKSKLIVDYRAQLNSYSEIMSLILREEVPAFLYFAGDKTIIKV